MIDPRNTLTNIQQVLPLSERIRHMMQPVMKVGVVRYIGTLNDYSDDAYCYYVPYDAVARPIPGVWIRGSDAALLKERLAHGLGHARLIVDSAGEKFKPHNVVEEMPGADENPFRSDLRTMGHGRDYLHHHGNRRARIW